VLEPLLFYVLHRVTTRVQDPAEAGTFKLCVMDEAWRFIQHPTLRDYVQEGTSSKLSYSADVRRADWALVGRILFWRRTAQRNQWRALVNACNATLRAQYQTLERR